MNVDATTARRIAERFAVAGELADVRCYGDGLINDTFLVVTDAGRRAILQRINRNVFPNPEGIQSNLRCLHRHRERLPSKGSRRLCVPEIIPTLDACDFYRSPEGFWRMSHYVDGSLTLRALDNTAQAYEIGAALGCFHAAFQDLDVDLLHDPLPGFHCTPCYLEQYDEVLASWEPEIQPSAMLRTALDFVARGRFNAGVLEDARRSGVLRPRVIHGDPKLDNVLFEAGTGRALGLIDLDTVKPGLILHDIGDCLRSCCNVVAEKGSSSGPAFFDLERLREALAGYFSEGRAAVTAEDLDHLYTAIRLLPFELGLRFLTDHLAGDTYFKVQLPDQNLQRAAVQFQLVESIERQEEEIRAICRSVFLRTK